MAALSWLALALIRAARSLRGWTSPSDAIFPLLLLHWGHAEVFLWGFELQYTLSIVLSGIIFLLGLGSRGSMGLGSIVVAGLCLVLLPLTGANGLIQVPALACWLLMLGTVRPWFANPPDRRLAVLSLGLVVAALLLMGSDFIGYQRVASGQVNLGLKVKLHAALQFLTGGFGPGAAWYWLWSGYLTVVVFVMGGLTLGAQLGRGPASSRFRALGMLIFLGSLGCLTLAMGWGRSFVGFLPPFFIIRYYSLAALAPCALYLVWSGARSSRFGSFMQVALFALVSLLTPFNMQVGLDWAHAHGQPLATLTREIEAGTTAPILAEHHRKFLFPWQPDAWTAARLQRLHDAQIGPFRSLQADPLALRPIPLALEPTVLFHVSRLEPAGEYLVRGDDPSLRFRLPAARYVHAIRVKCAYDVSTNAPVNFVLAWQKPEGDGPAARGGRFELALGNAFGGLWPGGSEQVGDDEQTITIRVDETIDRFRIQPDAHPCYFKLREITLLVPESAPTASQSAGGK